MTAMYNYNDSITVLRVHDARIAGVKVRAAKDLFETDLAWAAHVADNGVNVKAFFAQAAKDSTVTLAGRTVATWSSSTSDAGKVLAHYGPDHDTALAAVRKLNRDRVAAGQKPIWSCQTLAKAIRKADKADATPATPETPAAPEVPAAPDATVTDITPAKTQLDVVLAAIPHLSAADREVVRQALAAADAVAA